MSKTTTTAKMRADGTIVEVMSDGSERPFAKRPMRTMTEAEIETGTAADPHARPMTPEELRTARRVPRVKTLRCALGLTQQEFAPRYQIPLGTPRPSEIRTLIHSPRPVSTPPTEVATREPWTV